MGFGKTSTSIASLELMDKWPVLVMCPGHMVWKWQRDLERSSNPDEPITARVITRPVLDEPPAWITSIRPAIEAAGGSDPGDFSPPGQPDHAQRSWRHGGRW